MTIYVAAVVVIAIVCLPTHGSNFIDYPVLVRAIVPRFMISMSLSNIIIVAVVIEDDTDKKTLIRD